MSKNLVETASVLAFERKLSNSDALMYAGNWQERENLQAWHPISIQEKSVRGTISNRIKNAQASDPAKLDAEVQKANLQTVDVAALPFGTDTLKVKFTLRVLGNLSIPFVCNKPAYQEALSSKITNYIETHGFEDLALRYAENIANGRFLWRNRVGAEAVSINVTYILNEQIENVWVFDSLDFNLRHFSTQATDDLMSLAKTIEKGLSNKGYVLLNIEAFARIGEAQEVFPSQELILDNNKNSKTHKKSKTLYQVNNIAAIHSQKIGNALRTIDTWYPEVDTFGPIAIEPYGSVTTRGIACRQIKAKMDFYTLLDNWVLKEKELPVEQQHYVIATLIRGGVFSK
jgi:CRISPR-associated protein Csy3